ncbi:GTP cyclohydrolase I FolE [Desulfurispira natronophila]|uniref:GTP cyclohydrolase 1 n=1 Tax=Desulfurispira natronophila TaxID=682562 RepID=A0A7W8DFV5_9BACT|nr:GTP cyclohydrolase I FolE [Desulfurispira natronophila]MBB5020729.1 GTP cyclohydrolase I [Desulfurispira natronophila]
MKTMHCASPVELEARESGLTIEKAISNILTEIEDDPSREGLLETPQRVANMYRELTSGYRIEVNKVVNGAIFTSEDEDLVMVKDISFSSLCEHHMLPFLGKAHVAYIPDGRIIGLSKIPRIVEVFSKRLQVQERFTGQIGEALHEVLRPRGVAVMVEAIHMCAIIRGVKNHSTTMTTTSMFGDFKKDSSLRREFMEHTARTSKITIHW